MILIIDDHVDTGEVLVKLLKTRNHKAVAVINARVGLAVSKAVRPEAIVLDMMMPDVDGITFLRQLRQHPRLHDVPVLVYSGDFTTEKMREAKALGAGDYLVKGTVSWDRVCDAVEVLASTAQSA